MSYVALDTLFEEEEEKKKESAGLAKRSGGLSAPLAAAAQGQALSTWRCALGDMISCTSLFPHCVKTGSRGQLKLAFLVTVLSGMCQPKEAALADPGQPWLPQ